LVRLDSNQAARRIQLVKAFVLIKPPDVGDAVPAGSNQQPGKKIMISLSRLLALTVLASMPFAALQAQSPSASPAKSSAAPKRTDVYHVFFVKAAPGKAKELADFLKEPDPNAPDRKGIVLRHQDGDDWDYAAIEHIGTKATVASAGMAMPPSKRSLMEWHNDTFVNGPSWSEFAKAMGIDGDAAKTSHAVYSVSDYRATPGHRDDLEKILSAPPAAGDTSSGAVLLQHLEGASWNFISIIRYDSWEKFAANETNSVAQSNKGQGGWFELRDYVACHHDTLTDRILP
jgi:hypothetical protein